MNIKINLLFLILLLLAQGVSMQAQNLVPNPSFENYTVCPDNIDQIYYATGWDTYLNTSDYYNSCSTIGWGVPSNVYGYQLTSYPNCHAYAGLINYNPWSTYGQEFIGRMLDTTMTIGQKYFLEMKVSLTNGSNCTSNNLGFLFSSVPYNFGNPAPINNFAHFNYPNIITDTANWTIITGSFIADSAYKYIIIGNFFDKSHTDTLGINGGNCLSSGTYYYIDDVCVSTDSSFCNPYIYNCETGISENNIQNNINIYPNPAQNYLYIQFNIPEKTGDIFFYNILGNLIFSKKIDSNNNQYKIDLSYINKGLYFVKIQTNSFYQVKKLIIN